MIRIRWTGLSKPTRIMQTSCRKLRGVSKASAFRTSIDEISRWIIDAEKRGFAIVPASAALAKRT